MWNQLKTTLFSNISQSRLPAYSLTLFSILNRILKTEVHTQYSTVNQVIKGVSRMCIKGGLLSFNISLLLVNCFYSISVFHKCKHFIEHHGQVHQGEPNQQSRVASYFCHHARNRNKFILLYHIQGWCGKFWLHKYNLSSVYFEAWNKYIWPRKKQTAKS